MIGFAAGILTGVFFLKKGFSLGRAESVRKGEGLILPIVVVALFVLSVTTTVFAVSQSGPGSMHAPVVLSLIGGIAFGMLAQRSRLCFAGGLRDLALVRDGWGLVVIGILFAGVLIFNLVNGSFHLSFTDQPIAHNFGLASSANGTTEAGQIATIVCIVILFIIAAVNLRRSRA